MLKSPQVKTMSKLKNHSINNAIDYEKFYFNFRTGDYPTYHNHHGSWEFMYITSGEYTHTINKQTRILKPRTLCALRPDDEHSTHQNLPDSTYITCHIGIEQFTVFMNFFSRDVLNRLFAPDIIEFQVSPGRDKHINEIKTEYLSSSDFDYKLTCDAFLVTFAECLINQVSKEPNYPHYSGGVRTFIQLLTKPENLAFPLRDLISQTNYSYSHLNKIFTEEIGLSPSEYLKDKRLTYAKKLLSGTTYKHSFIAECIGFATYPRFCTFFKEKTGLTPSQYAAKYHTD